MASSSSVKVWGVDNAPAEFLGLSTQESLQVALEAANEARSLGASESEAIQAGLNAANAFDGVQTSTDLAPNVYPPPAAYFTENNQPIEFRSLTLDAQVMARNAANAARSRGESEPEAIQAGLAAAQSVVGAGHWVDSDAPVEFRSLDVGKRVVALAVANASFARGNNETVAITDGLNAANSGLTADALPAYLAEQYPTIRLLPDHVPEFDLFTSAERALATRVANKALAAGATEQQAIGRGVAVREEWKHRGGSMASYE